MNNDYCGYTERTYSLKTKDGKYAWIWDDTGKVKDDMMFDTEKEAQAWVEKQIGGHRLTWIKHEP